MACGLCCCRSRKSIGPPAGKWMNGNFWLIVSDPCGLFMAALVYAVALQTAFVVNVYILLPDIAGVVDLLHAVGYNMLLVLMLWSHFRCMTTNPGTAFDHIAKDVQGIMQAEFLGQKEAKTEGSLGPGSKRKWFCTKCSSYRPKRTHHCSTCRSCVLDMDHHCPWMNNCVGWRNHKYFLLFLVYAGLECTWSFLLVGYALFYMPEEDVPLPPSAIQGFRLMKDYFGILHESPWAIIWSIMMALVCFFLTIFVLVMACDQWEYLSRGYGAVDKKMMMLQAADRERAKSAAAAAANDSNNNSINSINNSNDEAAEAQAKSAGCGGGSQCADQVPPCSPCSPGSNLESQSFSSSPQRAGGCNRFLTVMGEAGHPCSWRWALPIAPGPRQFYDLTEDPLVRVARRRVRRMMKGSKASDVCAPLSPDAAGGAGCPRVRFAAGISSPEQREKTDPQGKKLQDLPEGAGPQELRHHKELQELQEQHQPDLAAGPPPAAGHLANANASANASVFATSSSSSSSSSSPLPVAPKVCSHLAGASVSQDARAPLLGPTPRSPGSRNLLGDDSDDDSDDSGSLDDSEISDFSPDDYCFEDEAAPATSTETATTTATAAAATTTATAAAAATTTATLATAAAATAATAAAAASALPNAMTT